MEWRKHEKGKIGKDTQWLKKGKIHEMKEELEKKRNDRRSGKEM